MDVLCMPVFKSPGMHACVINYVFELAVGFIVSNSFIFINLH